MKTGLRSVVARANIRLSIKSAALLLASATVTSSLLGIYRDRILNRLYYDTYPVGIDAYTVAFTVPDFMFFILVSGALSVSFIPVFNQRLASGNRRSAWELSTSMINFMALLTLIASVLIIIFADPLVRYIIGPGLDESGRQLAISMMRVIAVNPFLFAIATVIASIQQAVGRFTFYALAPIIYNFGIIIGALFFTNGINLFGWQVFEGGVMGVALGVVLGSMMQLVVSSFGLIGLGVDYRFKIYWRNKGFRKVLRLLPARSIDQGMDYLIGMVEINIASRLATGTIRAYQQATALHLMPINLIGVAISNAAFPKMTEHLSSGNLKLFRKDIQKIIRVIVWLALPIALITYFTRGYLVNFIYEGGDPLMAGLLGALILAIFSRSVYHIMARAFYAQQDTKTPMYVSLFTIGANIALAVLFALQFGWGAYGLAWAQSAMATLEVMILFVLLARRIPGLFNGAFVQALTRMAAAGGLMSIVSYLFVLLFPLRSTDEGFFATIPKFTIIAGASFAAYVALCHMMNISEARPVVHRVRQLTIRVLNR